MRCFAVSIGLLWMLLLGSGASAFAEEVRYFGVWSYLENAFADELPAGRREGRELGYWELHFDDGGEVVSGTYHGADGHPWLSVRYVEVGARVYADLYSPEGVQRGRKSTHLVDRKPRAMKER
ncbi:MAG: hypothetical protein ACE5FG_00630 [Myxococcota bacterium]